MMNRHISETTPACPSIPLVQHHNASDLCDILLSDDLNACRLQPLGVTDNFSFIIDLDYVQFEDLKADDLGVWKSTG